MQPHVPKSRLGAPRAAPNQVALRTDRRQIHDEILSFSLGETVPATRREAERIEQGIKGLLRLLILSGTQPLAWGSKRHPMGTRMAVVERDETGKRRQRSLLSGTIFARSHVRLPTWFRAMGLFVAADSQGISARRLQKELGLSRYETALGMITSIRGLLTCVRPRLVPPLEEGRLKVTTIWPALDGRPGSEFPIWITLETKREQRNGVWIQYEGARTAIRNPHLYWEDTGDGSMPAACQEIADGLIPWLRTTHRRLPLPRNLQPYLDEYAMRRNIRTQRRGRTVLAALIRVAAGEPIVDPFAPPSFGPADLSGKLGTFPEIPWSRGR